MCGNIKTLFNFEPPVTDDEIHAAALQFVRKVSGFNKPSKVNEAAFHAAVSEIAAVSKTLLGCLETNAPPRDREEEVARARARAAYRFAPSTIPTLDRTSTIGQRTVHCPRGRVQACFNGTGSTPSKEGR